MVLSFAQTDQNQEPKVHMVVQRVSKGRESWSAVNHMVLSFAQTTQLQATCDRNITSLLAMFMHHGKDEAEELQQQQHMVSNSLKTSTDLVHGGLFWCFPNSPNSDVDCRIFNPFTPMLPLENDQEKCKIWNPFCFLSGTGFWKEFHQNILHWKEIGYRTGKCTVFEAYSCICHPGKFTGWGSEGLMVCVCLWSFHILVYVHNRLRFIVSSEGFWQSRHRLRLWRNLRVGTIYNAGEHSRVCEYVYLPLLVCQVNK